MKVRKKYILFINEVTNTADYGTNKLFKYINNLGISIGSVYECNLTELKDNIKYLNNKGIIVNKRKILK